MAQPTQTQDIKAALAELAGRAEIALDRWLSRSDVPAELLEAMRYSVLGEGKRLRPALVMLSAQVVAQGRPVPVDPMPAAVAIELVHCYSLVHDDLPAMDNDTLRRGQPTVHVKFGQAMAILAGDALLTHAFAVLTEGVSDPAFSAPLVAELARSAGPSGMIAGQVADMDLCRIPDGVTGLDYIHTRKTAAMFAGAARMGAICGGANPLQRDALGQFALDLGLAFQVKDDLLDATGSSEQLGKTAGKDAQSGKRTYPTLLGLDRSAEVARELSSRALNHLECFGQSAAPLRAMAGLMLERRS